MSSPYEKILKRGAAEKEPKKKNASYNAHLHMISFDDSDDSSRVDIPNIFLDDRENHMESYAPSPPPHPKPQRKAKEVPPVRLQPSSAQEFDITKSPTKRLAVEVEHYHEP